MPPKGWCPQPAANMTGRVPRPNLLAHPPPHFDEIVPAALRWRLLLLVLVLLASRHI